MNEIKASIEVAKNGFIMTMNRPRKRRRGEQYDARIQEVVVEAKFVALAPHMERFIKASKGRKAKQP